MLLLAVVIHAQDIPPEVKKHQVIAELAINKPYPEFKIRAGDLRLNQDSLKGKVTLLNFWFEACPPCQAEMEGLGLLYQSLKDSANFRFYSFTFEDRSTIKRLTKQNILRAPAYPISNDACNQLSFGAGYPTNIIIDHTGVIRYFRAGGSRDKDGATKYITQHLEPLIRNLLNPTASTRIQPPLPSAVTQPSPSAASPFSKRFVYYFDADFNHVGKEKAVIVGQGTKTGTGVTVRFLVKQTSQLINICEYQDSTLSVINGKDIDFYDNGKAKQSSAYALNILNGITQRWDSTGLLTDSILYINGKMALKTQFEYNFSGIQSRRIFTDSVHDRMTDAFLDASGKKTSEVQFSGNRGSWRRFNTDGTVAESENVTTREKKEASFPGGVEKWKDYIADTLDVAVPFHHNAPPGEYLVSISFTIDKEGNLSNITPATKHGFGMEEEAVRVIKNSGKWVPAILYGKPIRSHRLQPIQFQVTKSL